MIYLPYPDFYVRRPSLFSDGEERTLTQRPLVQREHVFDRWVKFRI